MKEGTAYYKDTDDVIRPLTRERLQALADEEDIEINWDKWNEIVQKTKEAIQKNSEKPKKPPRPSKPKYVYDLKGNLIAKYPNTKECADALNTTPEVVTAYARKHKPHYGLGVVITDTPRTSTVSTPKYVYRVKWELVGVYDTSKDVENAFGIQQSIVTNYARNDVPYYKMNLWFRNSPIDK